MRRFVFAGLMSFIVLVPWASWAQEEAPWPPDPDAIFAEGVEVVEQNIYPVVDNDARWVSVYDQGLKEWRNYPYPEQLNHVFRLYERSDGTIYLQTQEYPYVPFDAEDLWILDPVNGGFSRPETICGDWLRELPGEGKWVFYIDPATQRTHLCITDSGELSEPLPEDAVDEERLPALSPAGKWLLLIGLESVPGTIGRAHVYGYEVATRSLIELGDFYLLERPGIPHWISEIEGFFFVQEMGSQGATEIYLFDVTQQDSL